MDVQFRLLSPVVTVELAGMFLLLLILLPAAISDYQTQKIPNALSMGGWVLGPALYATIFGLDGLLLSGKGFLVLFLASFPLWMLGWLGAADVKLMGSVGAIVGGSKAVAVLLGILLTGFLFAVIVALLRREMGAVLKRLYFAVLFRTTAEIRDKEYEETARLPYAIPISFGTFITLLGIYARQ